MGLILEVKDQVIRTHRDGSPKTIEKGKILSVLVNGTIENWLARNVRYSKEN